GPGPPPHARADPGATDRREHAGAQRAGRPRQEGPGRGREGVPARDRPDRRGVTSPLLTPRRWGRGGHTGRKLVRRSSLVLVVFGCGALAGSAPALASEGTAGDKIPGRYIVVVKHDRDPAAVARWQ